MPNSSNPEIPCTSSFFTQIQSRVNTESPADISLDTKAFLSALPSPKCHTRVNIDTTSAGITKKLSIFGS